MADRTFFITGASGLLGTEVVTQLLTTTDSTVYVLARAATVTDATYRLQALWWEDELLSSNLGRRIIPVVGDITKERLALDDDSYHLLIATVTHVIHCAADTGVQQSKRQLWNVNVKGTQQVSQLAAQMPLLQRFTYISTAYVAGTRSGRIMEDEPVATSFYSLYEESKAEAEKVVRSTTLPLTVCRPGMIVGNSVTGRTRNFNTVYYVLKLMLQRKLGYLPVKPTQTVNVIPVDYVARQVVALTLHPQAAHKTFHLTAPVNQLPQVRELVEAVRAWAKEHLHINVSRPCYLPVPLLRTVGKRYNAGKEAKQRNILSNLTALMPYFLDDHYFDRTHTDQLTGPYDIDWHTYLPQLLTFACRHNFMRLSERTIFEQAVIRRNSNHYPITYYNITTDGLERVSGQEMNTLVGYYVNQLKTMGVSLGDTVALSGINCAEHAAIDQAIGLAGAVSVPIYYTTPKEEIRLLLKKSGARWFFVGDERILQQLEDLPHDIKVIRFGPLESLIPKELPPAIPMSQSYSPASLATIRYTSGTTGEPKGVMFNYSQLKWMGEVLTNLLSWHDRNQEMHYLSFLPMSHVVEGILASYAPYCMLCKAKIYYLTDFQMLTKALPMVRPTVFFSVPRFYEKLWEQITGNAIGKKYLKMHTGLAKQLTGKILRKAILKKAGLNKCSQLIVGSAPMSEELLLHFREMGIEIHNAYGQTEAPLITINRLGDNVIPSIGTPLPDTTVEVLPDGELTVKGPQVALGYYQMESDTFKDGILHTGDLGSMDADGHVFIRGRKKDMLITSYGKNINCSKIEQRLTDIAGIEQAVLVGEQRPYCTALLWTSLNEESLKREIEQMNRSLSHPEQIKRWCVIDKPLSIKDKELTPNLKIRRDIVMDHYQEEINRMYG